jgi:hypothetical protein
MVDSLGDITDGRDDLSSRPVIRISGIIHSATVWLIPSGTIPVMRVSDSHGLNWYDIN